MVNVKKINTNHILLFMALVLAAILRLNGLNAQGLWGDELFSVYHSSPDFSLFRILGVSRWDPHPPLFLIALKIWMELLGFNEFTARLFVALTGIVSIIPVYFLGKELVNKNTGLIAGLLVSVNYFHLTFSQEVRPYMLLFLFSTLSYLFFIRSIRQAGKWHRIFYVLSTVLLLYTHYYGFFVFISQGIYLAFGIFFHQRTYRLNMIRDFLFSLLFIILLYSPMFYFVWDMLKKKEHWISQTPGPEILLAIFSDFFANEPVLVGLTGGLILVSIIFCVKVQRRDPLCRDRGDRYCVSVPVLLTWVMSSLLIPYFRSVLSVPMFSPKHALCVLAAVVVLAALTLDAIRPPLFKWLVLACILVLSVVTIFYRHDYYHKKNKQQWREAVTEIIHSVESDKKQIMTVVMSDEIRYSRCYFSLLKSPVEVQEPSFLNLKNALRNSNLPGLKLIILDWDEQEIRDRRFTEILSRFFILERESSFISIKNLTFRAEGQTLEKLRKRLNII